MDLRECILTKNECYQRGTKMTPKGIVWHSTGANNPSIGRYVPNYDGKLKPNLYNNHWDQFRPSGRQVCVHAFIGKDKDDNICTYQTLPWDMVGWHVGGSGNNNYIGFEICEDDLTDKDYFDKVYKEGVELTAHLCKLYGWNPKDENVIICHQDAYKLGIGSNHSDVYHWFNKYDKTMQDVRNDVYALLNNGIEDYSGYVQVIYGGSDGLDIHTEPTFTGSVAKVAKKGEVFQVVGRIKASGVYMYKLKDGNYITSADKYVKYTKTNPTPVAAKPITDNAKTYKIVKTINGYMNADNAKDRKNAVAKVTAGTYYIFNEAQGMKNVTKKKGTPGSWINPSDNVAAKTTTSSVVGKTLHLPATVDHWNVYPLSKSPTVGNECGALNPKKFGGLTYKILAQPQANVVTISTYSYGKVNIYVGKDTPAVIK